MEYERIEEIVRKIDVDGKTVKITEIYGYDAENRKFFINRNEVMDIYRVLGIERFSRRRNEMMIV